MSRRWVRLGLLGAGVFAVALVLQLPAAWALHLARDRLPADLAWQGVSGSIWDARAERVAVPLPGGRRAMVGPVSLRTGIWGMLVGRLPVDFRIRGYDGDITGTARLAPGSWRVPTVQGRLSLAALPRLDPRLAMADMDGRILFRGEGLAGSYAGLPSAGSLRATVEGLRVGLVQADGALGDYSLQLRVAGDGRLQGKVRTVNEAALLGVEGQVEARLAAGRIRFRGEGWTGDGASPAVRDILPLLGEVRDGRVRIRWQGRLR